MLADEWSYSLRDEYSRLPDSTGGAPGNAGQQEGRREEEEGGGEKE